MLPAGPVKKECCSHQTVQLLPRPHHTVYPTGIQDRGKNMLKVLLIIAIILLCLFVLSLIVYFFNLDMKLTSAIQPLLEKHYDKIKRNRKI